MTLHVLAAIQEMVSDIAQVNTSGPVWQAVCSFNQINRVLLKNLVSFSNKLGLLGPMGNKLILFERNFVF
jgi:hypothetical protein